MKTLQEEEYVHFVSCTDDLNRAWRLLNAIKEQRDNPLVAPAFKYALIEYSKPYRDSFGSVPGPKGKPGRRRLDDRFVPNEHRPLHERLLAARDQVLAHSDLSVREVTLGILARPYGTVAATVQTILHGTEELKHLDAIIALIEGTLDTMYIKEEQLKAALPLSPADWAV